MTAASTRDSRGPDGAVVAGADGEGSAAAMRPTTPGIAERSSRSETVPLPDVVAEMPYVGGTIDRLDPRWPACLADRGLARRSLDLAVRPRKSGPPMSRRYARHDGRTSAIFPAADPSSGRPLASGPWSGDEGGVIGAMTNRRLRLGSMRSTVRGDARD